MANDRLEQLLSYTRPGATLDTAGLADAVSAMCADDDLPLSAAEAAIAYDILCRLYPDAERQVRLRLAERLANRNDVPRALCLMIASDEIEIAGPAIRGTLHLDDDDLIRLVVEQDKPHKLAVAERPALSARVTDVLVYLADADVALALACNESARFSTHGLTRLVNASRTQPSLQEPLLRRTDLPGDLAHVMYDWVGQALKAFIRDTFGAAMAQTVAGDIEAAVASARPFPTPPPTGPARDRYPESFAGLLVALRRGDLRTVEQEIQALSKLPPHATQRVLYNGDGKALAVVCRALGAGRSLYAEVFSRLFGTPPYDSFSQSRDFSRAMTFFDQLPLPEADGILVHWRIRPETVWGDPRRFNAAWELRRRVSEKN